MTDLTNSTSLGRRLGLPLLGAALALFAACGPSSENDAGSGNANANADHKAADASAHTGDHAKSDTDESTMTADSDTLYSGTVQTLEGETVDLSSYKGKVTLVVNVASQCGFTPQYEGLQKLHEELGGDDFAILAFPSNDFGGQEPGSADEIREFCSSKYGVEFAMFEKIPVKAAGNPVYDKLASMTGGERPSWNFCKYVVSKDGTKAKFFKSGTKPDSKELRDAIASMRSE
jgi:glutathione peroxidase